MNGEDRYSYELWRQQQKKNELKKDKNLERALKDISKRVEEYKINSIDKNSLVETIESIIKSIE